MKGVDTKDQSKAYRKEELGRGMKVLGRKGRDTYYGEVSQFLSNGDIAVIKVLSSKNFKEEYAMAKWRPDKGVWGAVGNVGMLHKPLSKEELDILRAVRTDKKNARIEYERTHPKTPETLAIPEKRHYKPRGTNGKEEILQRIHVAMKELKYVRQFVYDNM